MTGRISDDAFDAYVAMGAGRSYAALAARLGVSKRGLTKLAARDDWAGRLARIESEAREMADKRLAESIDEIRGRHLKTLKAMNARAISALQQFPLTSGMEAVRAAELVIKLERLIIGEPSERTALSVEEVTRREIHGLLEFEVDDSDDAAEVEQ